MSQPSTTLTASQYKKALHKHAETLWQLHMTTLPFDAKLAAALKTQAEAAFDLHFEFCRIQTRYETEFYRAKSEHIVEMSLAQSRKRVY